ncbi:MAG: cob(I)yrinic acid a,c-diamide adenosyltransferase [Planctomycetota bacterium]
MTSSPSNQETDQHVARMTALDAVQTERVKKANISRGVVLVHTGEGKGKSTAGFGVAIRAAGHGQKVGLVQFIKGTWKTGEQAALKRFPEITHVISGDGFTWKTKDRANDIASASRGLDEARSMLSGGDFDVVILDEINVALSYGYLSEADVIDAVTSRPTETSVVLTGRGAPESLIDVADTVTEHRPVKHAFKNGIKARKGVEF